MTLYFINKNFKARRMVYDDDQHVFWLEPNFKEKYLKGHQVGFDLKLLRSVEAYPALSKKLAFNPPLVYFTLNLKDLKMAVGVDEHGLGVISNLEVPNPPSIDGTPIIQRKLW
jgi:hypothetical protein